MNPERKKGRLCSLTLIAGLIVISIAIGYHYSGEITGYYPLRWTNTVPFSWFVVIFWVVAVTTLVLSAVSLTKRGESLEGCLRGFFRSPLSSTIITLLIIVVGGIGAVYPDDIKKGFPFHLKPMEPEAILFWALTLLTSVGFFFRQREDDASKEEAHGRVLERAKELEKLIRTMPPANFLTTFADLYDQAEQVRTLGKAFNDPKDVGLLDACIRSVLRIIATLAWEFDGAGENVRYAANIMWYRTAASLNAEEKEHVRARLKFCDAAAAIENLRGILDLDVELSTTASDDAANKDDKLAPLAVPVPAVAEYHNKTKVLPGAPQAVVLKATDLYLDTSNLQAWFDKTGDFTLEVREQVQAFFDAQKNTIQSFISIPIFRRTDEGVDALAEDPIAVLNIHTNDKSILREVGEPVTHFVKIVRPLQIILAKMIMARIRLSPTLK